jgi:hypothetical protein
MADGQAYTHDEFVMLLTATLGHQLKVIKFNLFNFTSLISIQTTIIIRSNTIFTTQIRVEFFSFREKPKKTYKLLK